jgi:hypothetical protein
MRLQSAMVKNRKNMMMMNFEGDIEYRNSQDDLFSDDFCFKINKLVCNLAHIFIL